MIPYHSVSYREGKDGMGYGLLNIGSILFGLAALILPFVSRSKPGVNPWLCTAGSLRACLTSLFMQILYNNYLVRIGDLSALEDTTKGLS